MSVQVHPIQTPSSIADPIPTMESLNEELLLTTIGKILQALMRANQLNTQLADTLRQREIIALEAQNQYTAKRKALLDQEAAASLALATLSGVASIVGAGVSLNANINANTGGVPNPRAGVNAGLTSGITQFLNKLKDPQVARSVESTCTAASHVFQSSSHAYSTLSRARQLEPETAHNMADKQFQASKETESFVSQKITHNIQEATSLIQTLSRGG